MQIEMETKPSLGHKVLEKSKNKAKRVEDNKEEEKTQSLFNNVKTQKYRQNTSFVEIEASQKMPEVSSEYTPVAALNSMNPDWIIKVRIVKKTAPRHWKSFRGEGDLMNIELKDEYGSAIQGTFFNKHIEEFNHQVQEGKVYSIKGGTIKAANPKFSSIKHPYCITFNGHTQFTPLDDDGTIEQDSFSYTNIIEIPKMDNGKIIDVKGAVVDVEEMDEITMKNGMTKPIRRVIIADNSNDKGVSIQVTFWGKIAYKADFDRGEIIGIKDAKVGKYNGVSLNMSDECQVKKLKEDKELITWFNMLKNIKDITRLSEQNKKKFNMNEAGLKPQLINDIEDKVLEDIENETNPNYVIEGVLTFIAKSDNMVYMACPEDKKRLQKEFDREEWY